MTHTLIINENENNVKLISLIIHGLPKTSPLCLTLGVETKFGMYMSNIRGTIENDGHLTNYSRIVKTRPLGFKFGMDKWNN